MKLEILACRLPQGPLPHPHPHLSMFEPGNPSVCSVNRQVCLGPSLKYVTPFLANFHPLPRVTLCHTSRDPPTVRHTSQTPRFLVSLVQNTRTKDPCTNSLLIVRGDFIWGFCRGIFYLEGFVRGCFCP